MSVAGAIGQNSYTGDYWLVTGLASAQMTDQVHAEIGASYSEYTDFNDNIFEALAGIYYEPVSQLTFGLEGEYTKLPSCGVGSGCTFNTENNDFYTFDFVSVWRF